MSPCDHWYDISLAFRVFDTNGDGSIDMNEFIMAYGVQSSKDVEAQLDLVFSM